MCTSLSIAELPPLTLCTVQLDSSQGQDNVLLMSNNGSEPAIIRRGILKELFLPRSAFLRGRNSVLGFCAWTIRISCYRSRERATEYFIRDILARNIFVEAKGTRNILRVAALRQLYMQQLWWCPPQWWWLVVQGTWIFRIFGSGPGQASAVLATPGFPQIFRNSQRLCRKHLQKVLDFGYLVTFIAKPIKKSEFEALYAILVWEINLIVNEMLEYWILKQYWKHIFLVCSVFGAGNSIILEI